MFRSFILFVFVLFLTSAVYSQVGTIKVKRNKKDTLNSGPSNLHAFPGFYFLVSENYLFEGKPGQGSDISCLFRFGTHFRTGVEWSTYYRTFGASAIGVLTEAKTTVYLQYIRIPILYQWPLGTKSFFSIGIAPSSMTSLKNDDHRLTWADYQTMNIDYCVSIGRNLFTNRSNKRWFNVPSFLGVKFMGDCLPNLKNENVLNAAGNVIYTQRSRTYQVGLVLILDLIPDGRWELY